METEGSYEKVGSMVMEGKVDFVGWTDGIPDGKDDCDLDELSLGETEIEGFAEEEGSVDAEGDVDDEGETDGVNDGKSVGFIDGFCHDCLAHQIEQI